MLRRLSPIVVFALVATGCPALPSERPCNADEDCAATEVCELGVCEPAAPRPPADDAGARRDASVPVGEDGGPRGVDGGHDGGAPPPVDAGSDGGPSPSDAGIDGGAPLVLDAGADGGPPPPVDAGYDGGPPPPVDAGYDGGPPPVLDAGYDAGCRGDDDQCAPGALCAESGGCVAQIVIEVKSTVAECWYLGAPDGGAPIGPAGCRAAENPPGLHVDGQTSVGGEVRTFLRFDVPDDVDGRAVSGALELQAQPSGGASGEASGSVWRASGFDSTTIHDEPPEALEQLAPDQGAVALSQRVSWPLPASSFATGAGPIHLVVVPTGTDGIDYEPADTETPPVLVLELTAP